MIAKAATLDVDEVVVDLEDGTAAADKVAARRNLGSARARRTLAVRINGLRSAWWREDLAALGEHPPDVVVVPKVEGADDVSAVVGLLPPGVGLEVQIETARGLVEVERIAALDGPYAVLHDPAGLRQSAESALAHGCDGKWVVHPAQIAPVATVFTPSPEELARAKRILAAADGASALDGEMVDAATKRLAEGVIARGAHPSEP